MYLEKRYVRHGKGGGRFIVLFSVEVPSGADTAEKFVRNGNMTPTADKVEEQRNFTSLFSAFMTLLS